MADVAITRISSKGQIVIPSEMRKHIKQGDKFVIIKDRNRFILKPSEKFDKNIAEDLIFAKRTEEAWKRYEKGIFKSMNADDFLKELEKW